MKKRIKLTFKLHHWLGLVAGALLLVISLSGVALVLDDDIDAALFADGATLAAPADHLSIDASLARIRQQHPGWDIRIPELPTSPRQALRYELRQQEKKKWLYVHPTTGAPLAEVPQAHHRLTQLLLDLHYSLISGTPGKMVVALCGLSLLLLTVTGFLLYRRSILKVLLFRQQLSWKSRRSFFASLHRIVGVWALAFTLLMSVSGLVLTYQVLKSALSSKDKTIAVPPLTASVDVALQRVHRQYPDLEVRYLRFPVKTEGTLQLRGRFRTDPAYYGAIYSTLSVDYQTGEITETHFMRDLPWYDRLPLVLQALHFGDYAGYAVKLLYCFFGLMPGILSISGFFLWKYRMASSSAPKPHPAVA